MSHDRAESHVACDLDWPQNAVRLCHFRSIYRAILTRKCKFMIVYVENETFVC
jgi:hypothetical protein